MALLLKEKTHIIRIKLDAIITFKNKTLFSDWPSELLFVIVISEARNEN